MAMVSAFVAPAAPGLRGATHQVSGRDQSFRDQWSESGEATSSIPMMRTAAATLAVGALAASIRKPRHSGHARCCKVKRHDAQFKTPSYLHSFVESRRGNLAQYDDTWHIVKDGDAIPPSATSSDCSVEPSASEYAGTKSGEKAWISHSVISFDYRVVEVPRNRLLDPSCDALIFGHLAAGSMQRVEAESKPQRRLIVIDETVNDLYGARVRAYFEARQVQHEILVLPMIEENKSMDLALEVAKKMKQFNIDRRTEPVIAIGGGVCLDVVGLAASLFRRRTPYIRVPTTTLSYVDASVGAKSGVNFAGSKNRLGMYVPPCAALLDSCFFETQECRDVSNGMAEMAKMAIMKSEELFDLLEEHGPRLSAKKFAPLGSDDRAPGRVLQLSIETMLEELAPNLWEHSLDRLVDFGHCIGQDLEMAALGTEHELMHGESVACDMAFMAVLSEHVGLISTAQRDRTLNMLRRCQVPLWSPVMTYDLFTEAVANRVKNSMGQKFPLPVGIGKAKIVNNVSDEDLNAAFQKWQSLCSVEAGTEDAVQVKAPRILESAMA